MTLFDAISPNDIFSKVLDVFYDGKKDSKYTSNNKQDFQWSYLQQLIQTKLNWYYEY